MPDPPSSLSPSTPSVTCTPASNDDVVVTPAMRAHTTILGNFVHTLLSRYNALSVCEFMVTRPEQPWWMIDAANSNPGLCAYANDLRHRGQCLHEPPCHVDSLRCMGCGSATHFAFRGCPTVDAILESMHAVRITDERMLRVFLEYAQEPMYRNLRLRFRSSRPWVSPAASARASRKMNYSSRQRMRDSRNRVYLRDARQFLIATRRSSRLKNAQRGKMHPYKDWHA